jgi:hypothetical protein
MSLVGSTSSSLEDDDIGRKIPWRECREASGTALGFRSLSCCMYVGSRTGSRQTTDRYKPTLSR